MLSLKEKLEAVWNDKRIRNPLRKVHWIVADNTGEPAIKRKRSIKRIYNRLTKEFSWRK
jgi:hypothetical protein